MTEFEQEHLAILSQCAETTHTNTRYPFVPVLSGLRGSTGNSISRSN